AQALCLEEMLGTPVPEGSLFYGTTRRRLDVLLDTEPRRETEALVARMHALRAAGRTPAARFEPKCERCSLLDLCMPRTTGGERRVAGYLARIARDAAADADREDAP
ncbi:MAG: Dna2/Cas4 domain-containing protein, partial [Myxococcales bacterium]|nr:Dna2/Cas4 domain-containing protein [Myxococcales bacterium]